MPSKRPLTLHAAALALGALALALILAPVPALGSHGGSWHTVERASVSSASTQANGPSRVPSLSTDGRFVAFHSNASNLVEGDTNETTDVFVHDRQTGTTERVSLSSAGAQANSFSAWPSISADGRVVAFISDASDLVAGDTNGTWDVFVHDRQTGATERVSLSSSGGQSDNRSYFPSFSADGRFVAFESAASKLVAGDTNGTHDVFVHDRQTGITERVSLSSDGAQANGYSYYPSLSADGRTVAFYSGASNLVSSDTNGEADVFVHDRQPGATERVSVSSTGGQANGGSALPSLSADGRYVALQSDASNLVSSDTNGTWDVFVHDRQTGATERVSLSSAGAQANNHSYSPSLSADGRFVAFISGASNLVEGDTNSTWDVFVHDRQTEATERVSLSSAGIQADSRSYSLSLSADGRFVAFESAASNLVAGDTNGYEDVFVAQREEGPNTPPVVTAVAPDRILYAHRTWTLQVATFTDLNAGDTHTATIQWGDGTVTPGTVNQSSDTVSGSHRYLTPGTYTVRVTVSDNQGGSGEATFQVVVRPHPRLRQ